MPSLLFQPPPLGRLHTAALGWLGQPLPAELWRSPQNPPPNLFACCLPTHSRSRTWRTVARPQGPPKAIAWPPPMECVHSLQCAQMELAPCGLLGGTPQDWLVLVGGPENLLALVGGASGPAGAAHDSWQHVRLCSRLQAVLIQQLLQFGCTPLSQPSKCLHTVATVTVAARFASACSD